MFRQIRVVGAYVAAASTIGIVWLMYAMLAVFDIDVVPHSSASTGRPHPQLYLITAVVVTPIVLVLTARSVRNARTLAARGVKTTGRIESAGLVAKHGMSPMTISYMAGDTRYKIRVDLPNADYAVGQTVTVVYDPDRPANCDVQPIVAHAPQ